LEQAERTIIDQPTVCDPGKITRLSGQFTDGLGFFEYTDQNGNLITVPAIAGAPSEDGPGLQLGETIGFTLVGAVDGSPRVVLISIEKGEFGPGEIPFHGVATTAILIDLSTGSLSFSGEGSIIFDEPPVLGEPPTMHFSADLSLANGRGIGQFGGQ
jgi:hypothetical protein